MSSGQFFRKQLAQFRRSRRNASIVRRINNAQSDGARFESMHGADKFFHRQRRAEISRAPAMTARGRGSDGRAELMQLSGRRGENEDAARVALRVGPRKGAKKFCDVIGREMFMRDGEFALAPKFADTLGQWRDEVLQTRRANRVRRRPDRAISKNGAYQNRSEH